MSKPFPQTRHGPDGQTIVQTTMRSYLLLILSVATASVSLGYMMAFAFGPSHRAVIALVLISLVTAHFSGRYVKKVHG